MNAETARSPGVLAAIGAALLFGAGTPLAKLLLIEMDPWLLASLLYLGSGVGLTIYRLARRNHQAVRLKRAEWGWLTCAVLAGGVLAPVLLMYGLTRTPASSASLLLNAEAVFTALLAWFAFRENFDGRIALGMAAIVAGAVILCWPSTAEPDSLSLSVIPALAILAACLAWGLDNNLTRKVSLADATWLASIKGLVAGSTNLVLALVFVRRSEFPSPLGIAAAMVLGCIAYGSSLSLFVTALRYLGTARTGAYFSVAPFFGAVLAIVLLREPFTLGLAAAGILMGVGIWLHLAERHSHEHTHSALEHEHEHEHDRHHQHVHGPGVSGARKHTHPHRHEPLAHSHPHYPDSHHRHDH
jgi:drug/metabolite transporter (DMT)-like permease